VRKSKSNRKEEPVIENPDDRPIKPANVINIDEMPVGIHKKALEIAEPEAGKISFGIRE